MKIVQINATCGSGSTGKICVEISRLLSERGHENYILYTSGTSDYPLAIRYSDSKYIRRQALKARVFGDWGFHSRAATRRLIGHLERIRPDVVQLHNIHGHDCDLGLLFRYFREKKTRLIWTFHDCWAFTGYCMHFIMPKCDRWRSGCGQCPQKKQYSWFFDRSAALQSRKKALFQGLDLTVITPSHWLAGLVRESFLGDYPVRVIHNGIDLQVFRPAPSDFRQKHGLEDKKIVLGVAFGWGRRKGLDVFAELAGRLGADYKIVLVGTDAAADKQLPENILSIHRTQNQQELAQIYTAADVFANPTREENYPTVNMEALACGTPVVTFRTGGSPESLDQTCGAVVPCGDAEALEQMIRRICEGEPLTEACLKKAESFRSERCFNAYLELYEELV